MADPDDFLAQLDEIKAAAKTAEEERQAFKSSYHELVEHTILPVLQRVRDRPPISHITIHRDHEAIGLSVLRPGPHLKELRFSPDSEQKVVKIFGGPVSHLGLQNLTPSTVEQIVLDFLKKVAAQ
jgi:hypothetical protein